MDMDTFTDYVTYRDVEPQNFSYYKVVNGVVIKLEDAPDRGRVKNPARPGRPVGGKNKPGHKAGRPEVTKTTTPTVKKSSDGKIKNINRLVFPHSNSSYTQQEIDAVKASYTGPIYLNEKRQRFSGQFKYFFILSKAEADLIAVAFQMRVDHILRLRELHKDGKIIIDRATSSARVLAPKDLR